jgi:hypothetical protein
METAFAPGYEVTGLQAFGGCFDVNQSSARQPCDREEAREVPCHCGVVHRIPQEGTSPSHHAFALTGMICLRGGPLMIAG